MTVGSSSGGRKSHKDVPTVEALQVCGRFSCFSNGNGASLYKGVLYIHCGNGGVLEWVLVVLVERAGWMVRQKWRW